VSDHVRFMADKVTMEQVSLHVLQSSPSNHITFTLYYHHPIRCVTALNNQQIIIPQYKKKKIAEVISALSWSQSKGGLLSSYTNVKIILTQ
jgi:bifunctional DNase/RNase